MRLPTMPRRCHYNAGLLVEQSIENNTGLNNDDGFEHTDVGIGEDNIDVNESVSVYDNVVECNDEGMVEDNVDENES
eukprot:4668621-Ditylum_brightwellii.AAC.1